MRRHKIVWWLTRRLQRIDLLVSRGRVTTHAISAGAVAVSVVAGLVLALGGLLREPTFWLAVPPLVLIQLALGAVHRRARLSARALYPFPVEETYVEVPEPPPIEDEMLHAVGR